MPSTFDPNDPRCLRDAIERFRKARPDFEVLAEHLRTNRLPSIARRLGLYPIIMGRAKSLESFAEKIQRPGKDFLCDPLVEATDLAGVRVIVHLLSDVEAFAREVRGEFVIDEANSGDKSAQLRVQEFGYLSNHLIIQLREPPRVDDFEPPLRSEISAEQLERLPQLKCELQIRTLCQHAWADVFHELGYKNEFQLPRLWKREFFKLAAMLEVCDRDFMEIRNSMTPYESGYGAYMEEQDLQSLARRLEVLLEVDPKNVRTAHRLLRAYLALEDWKSAKELLTGREDMLCTYPPALRDFGVTMIQIHKAAPKSDSFKKGQGLLEEAVKQAPRDVDAWCSLGGSYRRQELWDEALGCYREGFTIEPDNPYALGQYIACELVHGIGEPVISVARAALTRAIERCHKQLEVRVNLPWAAFDVGLFNLYLGDLNASVRYNALGIHRSQKKWMVEAALNPIRSFIEKNLNLPGLWVIRELLQRGCETKGGTVEHPAGAEAPEFGQPVVILAGGCRGMGEAEAQRLSVLKEALKTFRGTLVSGGTLSGIAQLAGELQEEIGGKGLVTVGYIPSEAPEGIEKLKDPRYSRLRAGEGAGFPVREPLLFWRDYLSSGGDPKKVKLVGFNGGEVAACEYRMALAFGACVGIVEGSGREADAFLQDPFWLELDQDGTTRLHDRVHRLQPNVEDVRTFLLGGP